MTDITMGRFTTKYKISDFAESGYAILLGSHQAAIVLQVVDDFKISCNTCGMAFLASGDSCMPK